MAQRLVRRLCDCHKTVPATAEFANRLRHAGIVQPPPVHKVPAGCELCDLTGYNGRVGIYEMRVVDEAVRTAIRNGQSGEELRTIAQRNGMRLMYEQALEQVLGGVTTIDEVERVVPVERVKVATCPACERELAGTFLFCPFCGGQATPNESKPGEYEMVGQRVNP